MSEMVERVAKAIRESEAYWWNRSDEPEDGLAETLAKVAIEAMREPTEAMFCAGDEQIIAALHDVTGILRNPTPAYAAWQSMIDESLK